MRSATIQPIDRPIADPRAFRLTIILIAAGIASDVCKSNPDVDAGGAHAFIHYSSKLAKVSFETVGYLGGCFVIGALVAPGVARLQHLARHAGAGLGHKQTECGIGPHRDAL